MITILADKNIPFLMDIVPETFQVHFFDPDISFTHGIYDSIRTSVQGILIRTVSKIDNNNPDLALFPNLKFIGTASAGVDHVDVDYLSKQGVNFSSASGCNSNAVGEYVTTAILHWSLSKKLEMNTLQIGIIGVGKTGSSVHGHLKGLGCNCILYDPPRSNREIDFKSSSLNDLKECDVLTFHVPLTKKSQSIYPTFHWLNEEILAEFQGKLIVNASRGEVVDESALLKWKTTSSDSHDFIIDVWESEPNINVDIAVESWIATPHIAGYSNQSKRNATRMIVNEMAGYFDVPMSELNITESCSKESKQENPSVDFDSISSAHSNEIAILEHLHPMFRLSQDLKLGLTSSVEENIRLFRMLRTHSKLRDEFETLSVNQIQTLHQYPSVYKLLMISKGNV